MSEVAGTREDTCEVAGATIPMERVQSVQQLRKSLLEAQNAHRYVMFCGSGSHLQYGNVPARLDRVVSVAGLAHIADYEPADLTVTAGCGVTLAALQAALAEHGQWLPLDPAGDDRATLGGVLGANVSGPLRHRYGTARDWLLGARLVHADGTMSKSGGRVVKNVSGYDMHKLLVGSLGTLGAIAEATLKVAPLPRVDRTVAVIAERAEEAASVIRAGHESGLAIIAAELLSPSLSTKLTGRDGWVALLRLGGGDAAVQRSAGDIDAFAELARGSVHELEASVWEQWRRWAVPAALSMRISALPPRIVDAVDMLDRRFAGHGAQISATVTAGLARLQLDTVDDAAARGLYVETLDLARRCDGYVIVDEAPLALKRTIDVFGEPGPDLAIMRRLKQAFDPAGILAPGRFAGRI